MRLQYATALQLLQGLSGWVATAGLLQWAHALGAMMMPVREEGKLFYVLIWFEVVSAASWEERSVAVRATIVTSLCRC
jgi:hypothetical protein